MDVNYSYYTSAKGFRNVGGTAAQFLKADGSVDIGNYYKTDYLKSTHVSTVTSLDSALPNGGFISSLFSSAWGGSDRPTGASYGGYIRFADGTYGNINAFDLCFNRGTTATDPKLWFRTKNPSGVTNFFEVATREWTSGAFLPLTGGTINGNLSVFSNSTILGSTTAKGSVPVSGSVTSEHNAVIINTNWNYGLALGSLTTGVQYLQATRFDGTATNYDLYLNPNGGTVRFGGNLSSLTNELTLQKSGVTRFSTSGLNTILCSETTGVIYLRPQGAGATTGQIIINNSGTIVTSSHGDSSQWNTAYGYGNHATAGYAVLSNAQTFTNTNTFAQSPIVPAATIDAHTVNLGQLNAKLNKYVNVDDTQDVIGAKTFKTNVYVDEGIIHSAYDSSDVLFTTAGDVVGLQRDVINDSGSLVIDIADYVFNTNDHHFIDTTHKFVDVVIKNGLSFNFSKFNKQTITVMNMSASTVPLVLTGVGSLFNLDPSSKITIKSIENEVFVMDVTEVTQVN